MKVLAVDVGGTHVKILASGQQDKREFASGTQLTPAGMVEQVKALAQGWAYDHVSVGYPGPVLHDRPAAEPLELGHLPYRKATYEDCVGLRGLQRHGKKKWRQHVADVVERLAAAMQPDEIVIGGGNAALLKALPPRCRRGDNANAFIGGLRVWGAAPRHRPPKET